MAVRTITKAQEAHDEDWHGNNAAFSCPLCRKVFIVSAMLKEKNEPQRGMRKCPNCRKSTGYIDKSSARIEWPN
jgi:transcription elongation factor Elf1